MLLDIFYHPNSLLHEMGDSHFEAPERIQIIERALKEAPFETIFKQAQTANPADILRVHSKELYNLVKASQSRGHYTFTPDTIANRYTYQAALTAAGGSIQTGLNAQSNPSFAMLRPPGHHATQSLVMGFCFYNNIAISAQYLLRNKYKRIAIIDIDNHHGNGTQSLFEDNPNILYTSLHAHPRIAFPGTGYGDEVGVGDGLGKTVNIPLPFQTPDIDYLYAFDTLVSPIVRQFKPEIILVSLGFDGLINDPYGVLGLTPAGFEEIGFRLGKLAQDLTGNRIATFLEGGYNYNLMGDAAVKFFKGLLHPNQYDFSSHNPSTAIQEIVFSVRSVQRNYWYGI